MLSYYEPLSPEMSADQHSSETYKQPSGAYRACQQQQFYPLMSILNYVDMDSVSRTYAEQKTPPVPATQDPLRTAESHQPAKPKRSRTAFTKFQLHELEREFQCNKYLPRHRRIELSEVLSLDENHIKVWFQNRRSRERRDVTTPQTSPNAAAAADVATLHVPSTPIKQQPLTLLPPTPSPTAASTSDCSELDEILDFIAESTEDSKETRTVQNIKFDLELSAEAWIRSRRYHPYFW